MFLLSSMQAAANRYAAAGKSCNVLDSRPFLRGLSAIIPPEYNRLIISWGSDTTQDPRIELMEGMLERTIADQAEYREDMRRTRTDFHQENLEIRREIRSG